LAADGTHVGVAGRMMYARCVFLAPQDGGGFLHRGDQFAPAIGVLGVGHDPASFISAAKAAMTLRCAGLRSFCSVLPWIK
jgi:hypothetical protein